jgi:hypothetical protein
MDIHALVIMHSFLSSSRGQVELFSSCRNHRTAAGGGQGDPAGWGRTGRTGRTIVRVSLCSVGSTLCCTYLLVVELLGVLLGLVLGLLSVDVVETLGLTELVDLSASEGSNELLGELVVDRLALLALSLLKGVHGSERSTTSEDLVRELALVVVVVSLVVGVGRFTWKLLVLLLLDGHDLRVVLTPAEHCD